MLKLNDDKTEFLVVSSKSLGVEDAELTLNIGDCRVHSTDKARNLGVIFDNKLNMENHISQVCRAAYHHIRDLYKIRQNLTTEATISAVQALVTNKLDFSNAILYGLSSSEIKRLQKVQNCAARLICCTKRREHISPKLMELHWLKVKYRIQYKIYMLTYKCLKGMAPQYLIEMLQ